MYVCVCVCGGGGVVNWKTKVFCKPPLVLTLDAADEVDVNSVLLLDTH